MPAMLCGMDIDTFAKVVQERRLAKGWSVEEAARRARINRVTYKRIEDGLPVQDVKRRAVEEMLGLTRTEALAIDGASAAAIVEMDLNPDLAEFTDQELIDELRGRLLVLAGRLQQASGADLLTTVIDQDGDRHIVSHTTRKG